MASNETATKKIMMVNKTIYSDNCTTIDRGFGASVSISSHRMSIGVKVPEGHTRLITIHECFEILKDYQSFLHHFDDELEDLESLISN